MELKFQEAVFLNMLIEEWEENNRWTTYPESAGWDGVASALARKIGEVLDKELAEMEKAHKTAST